MKANCKYCNGTKRQKCHRCKGDGIIVSKSTYKLLMVIDPETRIYQKTTTTCFICKGEGTEKCSYCK